MINKRIKDRTGLRYGKLTAISVTDKRTKSQGAIWICKCDCGNVIETTSFHLQIGHKKSCGCLIKDVGVTKRLPKGKAGFNKVIYNLKKRSTAKGREYSLTDDQVLELTSANCTYCGSPPRSIAKHAKVDNLSAEAVSNSEYIYNGLDRIDNDIGYTIDNVITCCEICNKIRNTYLSVDETKKVIELIQEIRGRKNIWDKE